MESESKSEHHTVEKNVISAKEDMAEDSNAIYTSTFQCKILQNDNIGSSCLLAIFPRFFFQQQRNDIFLSQCQNISDVLYRVRQRNHHPHKIASHIWASLNFLLKILQNFLQTVI